MCQEGPEKAKAAAFPNSRSDSALMEKWQTACVDMQSQEAGLSPAPAAKRVLLQKTRNCRNSAKRERERLESVSISRLELRKKKASGVGVQAWLSQVIHVRLG